MRNLDNIILFLSGAAVCLLALYGGMAIQRAWLQSQQDAITVVRY